MLCRCGPVVLPAPLLPSPLPPSPLLQADLLPARLPARLPADLLPAPLPPAPLPPSLLPSDLLRFELRFELLRRLIDIERDLASLSIASIRCTSGPRNPAAGPLVLFYGAILPRPTDRVDTVASNGNRLAASGN